MQCPFAGFLDSSPGPADTLYREGALHQGHQVGQKMMEARHDFTMQSLLHQVHPTSRGRQRRVGPQDPGVQAQRLGTVRVPGERESTVINNC